MVKKVNLAKAVQNKKCLGYCWQMTKGKYEYQNDNDLGLDLDAIDCHLPYNKKVYVENGYYFYVMRGIWGEPENETLGVSLYMVKLLLKECHSHIFTLTEKEQKRLKKHWGYLYAK